MPHAYNAVTIACNHLAPIMFFYFVLAVVRNRTEQLGTSHTQVIVRITSNIYLMSTYIIVITYVNET
jgi:hypothetical protein